MRTENSLLEEAKIANKKSHLFSLSEISREI